jgi:hypothetical protein
VWPRIAHNDPACAVVYDHVVRHRRSLAFVAACLISAFLVDPASATSVVALRRGDTIVIGADSLQTLTIGGTRSVCKIAQGDGCFFAVIGPAWDPNHDVYQLGRTACASAPHIEDKTSNFLAALREPFAEMFAWALQRGPGSIGKTLTVVVIGQNAGRPVALSSTYRADLTRDPVLRPPAELAEGQLLLAGGDALKQFMAGAAKSAPPDAQLVRRAIAFDAASRPRDVGGAISILEVDRDGARWVEPGLCPPIDPALWR